MGLYRRNSGFSLIELLVVIAIVAILGAIVAPGAMGWRANAQLRNAAKVLRSDINQARMRAVRERCNVVMEFNFGGDLSSYRVFVDDGSGGGTLNDGIKNGSEQTVQNRIMPGGVVLNTGLTSPPGTMLWFTSRGIPEDGDSPVGIYIEEDVVIESPVGQKTFTINRIGRVSVENT